MSTETIQGKKEFIILTSKSVSSLAWNEKKSEILHVKFSSEQIELALDFFEWHIQLEKEVDQLIKHEIFQVKRNAVVPLHIPWKTSLNAFATISQPRKLLGSTPSTLPSKTCRAIATRWKGSLIKLLCLWFSSYFVLFCTLFQILHCSR